MEGKKSVLFLNLEGNSYFTKEQPNRHSKDLDKIFSIVCQTFYNLASTLLVLSLKLLIDAFSISSLPFFSTIYSYHKEEMLSGHSWDRKSKFLFTVPYHLHILSLL